MGKVARLAAAATLAGVAFALAAGIRSGTPTEASTAVPDVGPTEALRELAPATPAQVQGERLAQGESATPAEQHDATGRAVEAQARGQQEASAQTRTVEPAPQGEHGAAVENDARAPVVEPAAQDGGTMFPAYPGAAPIELEGDLRVDGQPISASSFRTRAAPAEVIAFHRRHFEARPVDLVENPLPDGRSLFVLDVREGRRCVVTATAKGRETEVIRGCTGLMAVAAPVDDLLPRLPDDVEEISRVDDELHGARAVTWSGRSPRSGDEVLPDLRERFLAAGWSSREGDGGADEAEGVPTRTQAFHRQDMNATLSVGSVPGAGSLVVIRILPGR